MENFQTEEQLIKKIEVEKEVLETLPKNNEKNISKYIDELNKLKKQYSSYKNDIETILEKRYKKFIQLEQDKEISLLDSRINSIEKILYLLSDEKTSYEKMNLDKIIYKLNKYYNNNLDNVNEQIYESIKMFEEVGIDLTYNDFDYSEYTKQYMQVFLEEKNNKNSQKMKNIFEEIYWKCPEIILQIELNIRNIYFKKENIIDKYYQKQQLDLIKKWNKKPEEIKKAYLELIRKRREKIEKDKKYLLNKFFTEELKTKDYTEAKINECYEKLFHNLEEITNNQEQIYKNITDFLNNLYEYNNYIEFKFIIDDIKSIYTQKDQNEKAYINTKKQINAREKKLNKKSLLKIRKNNNDANLEKNKLISELQALYKQLDKEQFNQKVCSKLQNSSTIYEILKIAKSNYGYLADCFIRNNSEITQEEIDEKIVKLKQFMKSPYHTIISNIHMLEEKDILMIIKDKYRLLNFKIDKQELEENIETIIKNLNTIKISIELKKADLSIKQIEENCEVGKILKNK